jgi:hypothetical protein
MTTSIQVPSTSSFMNHPIIQCNILPSCWQCQNNKQKNKAADLFCLTWVGFIYQMLIFGEGRVQCMEVSKKMLYVGQKTCNWSTGPLKTKWDNNDAISWWDAYKYIMFNGTLVKWGPTKGCIYWSL